MNTFTAYGRLVADPETRQIKNGFSVTDFRFVSNRKKKDKEFPLWLTCYVFNENGKGLGESLIQKYAKKGNQAFITGILEQEEYTDKEGNKRTSLKVQLSDNGFNLIGGSQTNGEGGGGGGFKTANKKNDSKPQWPTNDEVDFSGAETNIPF